MITATEPKIRDYLSYSAVRTFQSCPLKYRFRYVDGLAEDCVSSSLIFGSAIHSAVESYLRQQLSGESAPGLDLLLDVYQESWKERAEDNIEFGKSETADSLHEMSARMLQKFLNSDLIQPDGRIIGIEEEFRGVLIPGLPDLLGYPVVCDVNTAKIAYDNYEVRWGDPAQLDRYLQGYAVEKAKLEARKKGHSVFEQPLNDGSIKLTI